MSNVKPACKQCQYFDPNTSGDGKGMCRINPPSHHHGGSHGSWPMINRDAWCGAFVAIGDTPTLDIISCSLVGIETAVTDIVLVMDGEFEGEK